MMTLRDKTVTGAFWQMLNVSSKAVVHVLYLSVMARLLDKETFGVFALIAAVMLFVTLFSEFGIGAALIQRRESSQAAVNTSFAASVTIGLVLYGVVFFSAPLIVSFYDNQVPIEAIRLIALNLIINSFAVVPRSLVIRDLNFRQLFFIDAFPLAFGNVVVGITLGALGFGLWALVVPPIIVMSMSAVIALGLRPLRLSMDFRSRHLGEMMNFGGMLMAIRLVNFGGSFADKILLGKFVDFGVLGTYERAQRISLLPDSFLGESLDGVVFSGISRAESPDHVHQLYLRPLGILSLILFPLAYVMVLYSGPIVDVVLGHDWTDAIPLLQVFALVLPFRTMTKLSDAYNRAKKFLVEALAVKLIFAGVVAVLTWMFYSSIERVAASVLAATVLQWVLMTALFLSREHLSYRVYFRAIWPGIQIALVFFSKAILLYCFTEPGHWQLPVSLFTDVLLILVIIRFFPFLLGKENIGTIRILLERMSQSCVGRSGIVRRLRVYLDGLQ